MNIDAIRELLNRDPFVPFRIILSSGKACEVNNPDLVALDAAQLILCEAKSDRYAILRLNQITSVEVQQAA